MIWLVVALAGAGAYGAIALHRGENLNSAFILTAALCNLQAYELNRAQPKAS